MQDYVHQYKARRKEFPTKGIYVDIQNTYRSPINPLLTGEHFMYNAILTISMTGWRGLTR